MNCSRLNTAIHDYKSSGCSSFTKRHFLSRTWSLLYVFDNPGPEVVELEKFYYYFMKHHCRRLIIFNSCLVSFCVGKVLLGEETCDVL